MTVLHRIALIAALACGAPAVAFAQSAPPAVTPPATPAVPAPVTAPASAPALSERDRLGGELVAAALGPDFDDKFMAQYFADADAGSDIAKYRADWPALLRGILAVELKAYLPRHKLNMARVLLADFTVEELRAGVAFARTPGGRRLMAKSGRPATPAENQAMANLTRTPVGRSFLRKYNALKPSAEATARIDRMTTAEVLPRSYLVFVRAAREREAKAAVMDANGQLALKVAHAIAVMRDFPGQMTKSTPELSALFSDPHYPAGWRDLISEAGREELKNRPDLMEIAMAPELARYLSPEELNAGVAFLDSPAGQQFVRVARARQDGDASADLDKAGRKALQKLMADPVGKGFIDKIDHLERMDQEAVSKGFVVIFLLDVFEAFALKAQLAAAQPA